MSPTSILCRAQEAMQRDRAAGTMLANVRAIAEKAADAWAVEALLAEQREQRQDNRKSFASDLTAEEMIVGDDEELTFSENPDRGFAHA
jgi:hypothetical protein